MFFEVRWGVNQEVRLPDLDTAVEVARNKCMGLPATGPMVVPIRNESGVVVAVVTDDANGLSVHFLDQKK